MFNGKAWDWACSQSNIQTTAAVVDGMGKLLRTQNPFVVRALGGLLPKGLVGGHHEPDPAGSAFHAGGVTNASTGAAALVGSLNFSELVQLENVVVGGGDGSRGGGEGVTACTAEFAAQAPYHNNPIGTLHGGCQAMLAEQLGAKCAAAAAGSTDVAASSPMTLGAIQVSFFRPGAGQISLAARADDAGAGGISTCVDLTNTKGKLISQARLSWC
jgi:acyl-coenzyme A thioesterase PaaI-like protein